MKFVKSIINKFLSWVVSDRDNGASAEISFSSAGMAVRGFMRDYRLLSKIDPKHFIDAKGNIAATSSMFNRDPTRITFNARMTTSDDEAAGVEELSNDTNSEPAFIVRQGHMPQALRIGYDTEKGVSKHVEAVLDGPTPKSILHELGTVPVPADFKDLDKKLTTYLKIHDLIRLDSSRGNKETIQDVIQRLQNRKKYAASTELQTFFRQFKCTTDEAINVLMDKHQHLKIGPADDFIPEMPTDAHEKMLAYSDKVVGMCGSKPVFYLIAKSTDFRTRDAARAKRDPILLVQAPIGFFWQIIGAWGEEDMLLVNDL